MKTKNFPENRENDKFSKNDSLKLKKEFLKEFLLKQGFYLNDGIKYGLDLLVYTDLPSIVHSKYGLIIDRDFTYQELVLLQRVCNSNNKILIVVVFIGENIDQSSMKFVQCERFLAQKYL